jgi:predicted acyl esterase
MVKWHWMVKGILRGRIPLGVPIQYLNCHLRNRIEKVWVTNPASGVNLRCYLHFPAKQNHSALLPAIIMIPGAILPGDFFNWTGEADVLAGQGFAVIHWDPEGRGESGGREDFAGTIHQEGLQAILKYVASRPEINIQEIGVASFSYGNTFMGGITRHPEGPSIRFWIDWEGPSDRKSIEKPLLVDSNRPHLLLHDLKDEAYWSQREAVKFLRELACPYLRIQGLNDHAQPDIEHGIQCINAATHRKYGGEGQSPWTRINGPDDNPANHIYSAEHIPSCYDGPPGLWVIDKVDSYARELLSLKLD